MRAKRSMAAVKNLRDFVEMGIDFICQIVELTPCLAKIRRTVGRLQQFTVLPLHVIYNASPVEASMQADGDKTRLARHETRALGHQGQRLILLFGLGFDNGDLRNLPIACLNVGHGSTPLIKSENPAHPALLALCSQLRSQLRYSSVGLAGHDIERSDESGFGDPRLVSLAVAACETSGAFTGSA